MLRFSAHTADDRGQSVPVFNPYSVAWRASNQDPELADITRRLVASTQLGAEERLGRAHLPVLVMTLVTIALLIGTWVFMPGLPGWVRYTLLFAVVFVMGRLMWFYTQRRYAAVIRETLLSEGRCASCAYRLVEIPADADQRITCPECSAVWSKPRIGTRLRPRGPLPRPGAPRTSAAPHTTPSLIAAFRQRPVIHDADSHAVTLIHPLLRELPEQRLTAIGPDRTAAARVAVRRACRRPMLKVTAGTLFLALLFLGPVIGLLLTFNNAAARGGRPFNLKLVAPLGIFWLVWLFFLSVSMWRLFTYRSRTTAKPAARALVRSFLCPACGGDLGQEPRMDPSPTETGDAEPGSHNLIRFCTDCNAAWNPKLI